LIVLRNGSIIFEPGITGFITLRRRYNLEIREKQR
jgi:hypothetical protein